MPTIEVPAECTSLIVHDMARDTMIDCYQQANAISEVWKHHEHIPEASRWATDALKSWGKQLSWLFTNRFGDSQQVFKDGELCLFVRTNSGFVFGVIFHPAHHDVDEPVEGDIHLVHNIKRMGRYCAHGRHDPDPACLKPLVKGECPEHGEQDTAFVLPVPGDWSAHS